jgi:hypothetical protein
MLVQLFLPDTSTDAVAYQAPFPFSSEEQESSLLDLWFSWLLCPC